MMDGGNFCERRPAHPWLSEFEKAPDVCFDKIVRGAALIHPYGRADALTVLPSLFNPLDDNDPLRALLDRAVAEWLEDRRLWPHARRHQYGLKSYIRDATEALSLVPLLQLPETGRVLRENYFAYLQWVNPLIAGTANDLRALFWRALAEHQPDNRFRSLWHRICRDTGARQLRRYYLDIGLFGLRRLPGDEDAALQHLLDGLAAWARTLPATPQAKSDFLREWGVVQWIFTKPGKTQWQALVAPLIGTRADATKPFAGWWREAIGVKPGARVKAPVPHEPDPAEVTALVGKLKKVRSAGEIAPFRAKIDAIIAARRRWADATGDSYYLVRTAGNLAGCLLELAPDLAISLARQGLEWEPNNPFLWNLWGRGLVRQRNHRLAEAVFWEALRRFPDDEHSHVELARLLIALDRKKEALPILQQAAARFPDDEPSHVELARLLSALGRQDEALPILQHSAAHFPDNGHSHVELARLLATKDDGLDTAINILEKFDRDHPGDAVVSAHLDDFLKRRARIEAGQYPPPTAPDDFAPPPLDQRGDDGEEWAMTGEGTARPVISTVQLASDAERALEQDARVTRADFALSPLAAEHLTSAFRTERREDLQQLVASEPDHAYARVVILDRIGRPDDLGDFLKLFEVELLRALKDRDEAALRQLDGRGSHRGNVSLLALVALGCATEKEFAGAADWLASEGPNRDDLLVSYVHKATRERLRKAGVDIDRHDTVRSALPKIADQLSDILRRAARMAVRVDIAA